MKILIVDDDVECCTDVARFLKRLDFTVDSSYNAKDALKLLNENIYDVILSDVSMPGMDGFSLVKEIKKKGIKTDIILISGKSEIINSIDMMDLGIYDFVIKPIDIERIIGILNKIKNKTDDNDKKLKKSLDNIFNDIKIKTHINIYDYDFPNLNTFENKNIEPICVYSKKMKNIYNKLQKIQEYSDIPILIAGQTGTGKELIAKFIHYEGPFQNTPFVAINCAAINKEMFEAELFGYVKGAFTGANPEGRDGFVQIAENGTLFLDEISELALDTQTKLLRLLQEKEYYKIGGSKKYFSNARFVCATNMNIESLVKKGLFRKDLYFRLNLCNVLMPSLADRREEIIPLTLYFIKTFCKKYNRIIKAIESKALLKIYNHDWPGNIRELKNLIIKSIMFSDGKILKIGDIEFLFKDDVKIVENTVNLNKNILLENELSSNDFVLPDDYFNLENHVRSIIEKALNKFNGNKTKAAKYLGITRMQLYNRYKL